MNGAHHIFTVFRATLTDWVKILTKLNEEVKD
jgi:hypothetical protein